MNNYKPLLLTDKMPFGKYKDKSIETILKVDPKYLEWLLFKTTTKLDDHLSNLIRQICSNIPNKKRYSSYKKGYNEFGPLVDRQDDSNWAMAFDWGSQ